MISADKKNGKNILIGAIAWTLAIQYFICEYIVAHAWVTAYSIRYNFISDLGATSCYHFSMTMNGFVCSPLHSLMNASFFINGVLILVGLFFIQKKFVQNKLIRTAGMLMGFGSIGLFIVALFPENTITTFHLIGAGMLFVLTNLALVIWGIGMYKTKQWPVFALYTFLSGAIGLLALIVLLLGFYHSLGIGLVERIVGYPLTVWLVVTGSVVLWKGKYHSFSKEGI